MASRAKYIAELYDSRTDTDDRVLNEIYSIWGEVYGNHFDPVNKYKWFYKDNPAGKGALYALYKEGGNSPVGVQGVSLRNWFYQNSDCKANIFVDLAVKKNHRTLGPASKLVNEAIKKASNKVDFSYAFPNEKSIALFIRAKFKKIGTIDRYVKVLNYKKYFDKLFPGIISSAISKPLTFYYSLIDYIRIYTVKNQYSAIYYNSFTKEFDGLWEEVCGAHVAISKRDSDNLGWYFDGKKLLNYKILTVIENASGRLVGYFVYYLDKSNNVVIIDFLARDFNQSIRIILIMFINELRKDKKTAVSLEFYGSEDVISQLDKLGFKKRESSDVLFKASNTSVIQQKAIQYMTHFDRDQ